MAQKGERHAAMTVFRPRTGGVQEGICGASIGRLLYQRDVPNIVETGVQVERNTSAQDA